MNFLNVQTKIVFSSGGPLGQRRPLRFLRRTLVFSLLFAGAGARCSQLVLGGEGQPQASPGKLKRFWPVLSKCAQRDSTEIQLR